MKALIYPLILILSFGCQKSLPKRDLYSMTHDIHSDFVGNWQVRDENNNTFYIMLYPDGTALNTWGPKGEKGTWQVVATRAEIRFDSGWFDFIFKHCDNDYVKIGYSPGSSLSGRPANTSEAIKVKTVPEDEQTKVQ